MSYSEKQSHTEADVPVSKVQLSHEVKVEECHLSMRLWICYRYKGQDSPTNMVILDIKMLSGFVPDPSSVNIVSLFSKTIKYSCKGV